MVDIDERIDNILRPYFNVGGLATSSALPKCRDEIKQVFAEAGYKPAQKRIDNAINTTIDQTYRQYGLMTGQEFYDRFEKEYKAKMLDKETYRRMREDRESRDVIIFEAAKRAAGLTADSPTSDKPAHHHYLDDMTSDKLHGYEG